MTNKYLMKERNLHQDWVYIQVYSGLVSSTKEVKVQDLETGYPDIKHDQRNNYHTYFFNTGNKHDCLQFPYKNYIIILII